jgi:hypothetical protein
MNSTVVSLVSLSLFVAACASNPKSPAPPAALAVVSTRPNAVGEVVLADSVKYPNARLGVLYRYRHGDFRPDVYLYAKEGWPDPQGQAQEFVPTLDYYQHKGEYESYRIQLTQPIVLNAGDRALPGHEIVVRYDQKDHTRDSYFAVVSLPNEYVKFRITQRSHPNAVVSARDFVNAWLAGYFKSAER